jgi:apolipoprotein N-acyltransferase
MKSVASQGRRTMAAVLPFPVARVRTMRPVWVPRQFSWTWLGLLFPFLVSSTWHWAIPIAAWVGATLFLRFLHTQPVRPGLVAGAVLWMAALDFAWRPFVALSGLTFHSLALLFGLVGFLPFALDRLLARQLHGFRSTLLLPTAWVAAELLIVRGSPFGTYGSVANTQVAQQYLLQLASLTGMAGITFLIGWVAAVANRVWEGGLGEEDGPSLRGGALVGGALCIALFVWSPVRLQTGGRGTAVRVAGVGVTPRDSAVALLARQADAGARILVTSAFNGFADAADMTGFVGRLKALARNRQAYLFTALRTPDQRLLQVALDTTGAVRWTVDGSAAPSGSIRWIDTPYGRVAVAFDAAMGFPQTLRQAGRDQVDLLLVPAGADEPEPLSTAVATARAVENGFALVRETREGTSVAIDAHGRTVAQDAPPQGDGVLSASLPTRGSTTLYSGIGDAFAWTCLAACLALLLLSGANWFLAYEQEV